MIFEQRQFLIGSTYLALREHGLYVCQRNPQGLPTLETEMPYEEILPVRAEHHRAIPVTRLVLVGMLTIWLGISPWLDLLMNGTVGAEMAIWLLAVLLGGCNSWLLFERQWSYFRLHTSRLTLTLAGRPWQRTALANFAEALDERAKAYLRREYASINPLGPIELQLNRLRWLHGLDVLTEAEARTRATRLTGRLSTDTLRSMGQNLEMPYVN